MAMVRTTDSHHTHRVVRVDDMTAIKPVLNPGSKPLRHLDARWAYRAGSGLTQRPLMRAGLRRRDGPTGATAPRRRQLGVPAGVGSLGIRALADHPGTTTPLTMCVSFPDRVRSAVARIQFLPVAHPAVDDCQGALVPSAHAQFTHPPQGR
jgi:hypothetical protein